MNPPFNSPPTENGAAPQRNCSRRGLLVVLAILVTAVVVIFCATVNRTVVAPPQIPGAEFVCSETCKDCHAQILQDFKHASHHQLQVRGPKATHPGCEGSYSEDRQPRFTARIRQMIKFSHTESDDQTSCYNNNSAGYDVHHNAAVFVLTAV